MTCLLIPPDPVCLPQGRRLHGEALLYGQGPTVEGQAASGMSAIQQHNILEQFKVRETGDQVCPGWS
jgi:hypothetical protein